VLICLTVFAIATHVVSESLAAIAAVATALFAPIPYFGALVMTEVWTTFLFTVSAWLAIRALRTGRLATFAVLGVVLALTTLSRPAWVLFPIALAAVGVALVTASRVRSSLAGWSIMLVVFVISMIPWLTYNYLTIGRFTLSPAGGVGRGIWEGSWQATWSGRLESELTHLAESVDDRSTLDYDVTQVAARERLPSEPMLRYTHQWQDLHRIWATPTDPYEIAIARIAAEQAYLRVGVENIRADQPAHQIKRVARGLFILWAGEIPIRYSDINRLPAVAIWGCWIAQVLLCVAAMVGIYAIGRIRPEDACLLATPIMYVTAVHLPFLTEARQSLPAQPVLLILATAGVAFLTGAGVRSHPLPAVEPHVHEGEHL
jgi:4-amino-4-deoxy-L-arabinose transferase-like glycosyltransferase